MECLTLYVLTTLSIDSKGNVMKIELDHDGWNHKSLITK